LQSFLTGVFKIALASFLVGGVLTFLGFTPEKLIAIFGFTPESFQQWLVKLFNWVAPRIYLGAIVVVPVWLLIYAFLPRGRD
jgi:hypothetical protein